MTKRIGTLSPGEQEIIRAVRDVVASGLGEVHVTVGHGDGFHALVELTVIIDGFNAFTQRGTGATLDSAAANLQEV